VTAALDAPRLRIHHLLVDGDGRCRLLYDLERTLVLDVPAALQERVAHGLIRTEADGDLTSWLRGEGILTTQPRANWSEGATPALPTVTDVSLDMSGRCNMGCTYCFENDIDSRLGAMSVETALATLDFAFERSAEAKRLNLHFGSGEPLINFALLERVVTETMARAQTTGHRVGFELTTNATLVTPAIAAFLRDHPFNVRVSCDGPPEIHDRSRPMLGGQRSYPAVERGLRTLLEMLPERVTVNSVLSRGVRLRDLWAWANELGLRQYHVIKVGTYAGSEHDLQAQELAEFRADLQAICDDMFADLEAGRTPLNYQPITKIVRRLMIPEPITRFCGVSGSYLGVASDGEVYPCFRHLGLKEYHLGDVHGGVDDAARQAFLGSIATDVDSRPVCNTCWARYLCGGGCYADSSVYGPDKRAPQVQHCPFWRTEIELAIRFHRRLVDADPFYCLRLFGDDPEAVLGALGSPKFVDKKNCS